MDECVVKWFKQARDKKIPVSGPLVRAKAEEFASNLGKNDFKASTCLLYTSVFTFIWALIMMLIYNFDNYF